MPLYLVRWGTALRASLVSARDADELIDVLDQEDDPGSCTYQVYRGPVWIDFRPPFQIRDITPEKKTATDVSDWTVEPLPDYDGPMDLTDVGISTPYCDSSMMMLENLTSFAFPHLAEWIEESADARMDPDAQNQPFPADLRAALVADLAPLVRHSQAIAALDARTDPEAKLMKEMGVTVIPSTWTRRGERGQEDADLTAAIGQLADVLAGQLGISPEKVVEALNSPDARECLGDLSEAWLLMEDARLDEDDLDEDEGDEGAGNVFHS